MYDYLRCEAELPDGSDRNRAFQTKDFDCELHRYTITATGRLIHHEAHEEVVPERERPYFGTADWPQRRGVGALRLVEDALVDLEWHGYVRFYDDVTEYRAKFTDGALMGITAMPAT